jgi:hypothetical protein
LFPGHFQPFAAPDPLNPITADQPHPAWVSSDVIRR